MKKFIFLTLFFIGCGGGPDGVDCSRQRKEDIFSRWCDCHPHACELSKYQPPGETNE